MIAVMSIGELAMICTEDATNVAREMTNMHKLLNIVEIALDMLCCSTMSTCNSS